MEKRRILTRKISVLILNFIGLALLFYIQNIRYNNLIDIELNKHDEVLRNVGLAQAGGNDLNLIILASFILIFINIFIYKN